MDLVADALIDRLRAEYANEIDAVLMRPALKRRFSGRTLRPIAQGEVQC
jgi:hypothetical protein